jgi:hypothetical protein
MHRALRSLLGLALAVGLATGACGFPAASSAPPSGIATPTAATTPTPARPTVTPQPTPDTPTPAQPTQVPTPAGSLPAFACDTEVAQPGSVPIAYLRGLDAANGEVAGSIVFTFAPSGNVAATPDVTVRPVSPPFVRDPSGLPLAVEGTRFLEIVLQGGTALDASSQPTFEGPFEVTLEGGPIVELRRAGDFEAVSTFIVGLDGPPCVRILPPDGTSRVVIQVQTQ